MKLSARVEAAGDEKPAAALVERLECGTHRQLTVTVETRVDDPHGRVDADHEGGSGKQFGLADEIRLPRQPEVAAADELSESPPDLIRLEGRFVGVDHAEFERDRALQAIRGILGEAEVAFV